MKLAVTNDIQQKLTIVSIGLFLYKIATDPEIRVNGWVPRQVQQIITFTILSSSTHQDHEIPSVEFGTIQKEPRSICQRIIAFFHCYYSKQ